MRTLHTAASRPYDIVIGPGLLKEAGERSRRINCGVRVLLVSDSNEMCIRDRSISGRIPANSSTRVPTPSETRGLWPRDGDREDPAARWILAGASL